MPAREFDCKVVDLRWLTPTVFSLRFEPSRRFSYEPGQFLSIFLPGQPRNVRRIYSFSSPGKGQYELCVQVVTNGLGSNYLASLKPGDTFRVSAPYGDFFFETKSHRNACFIATSTGIAPFKSIVLSDHFRKYPPQAAMLLYGARYESEILYQQLFEQNGVEVVNAISKPGPGWRGFAGRVTDFLRSLPESWAWQETDFYLCGNGFMIQEVRQHLVTVRQVAPSAIRQEAYFSTHNVEAPSIVIEHKEAA